MFVMFARVCVRGCYASLPLSLSLSLYPPLFHCVRVHDKTSSARGVKRAVGGAGDTDTILP